ncbi:MAG: ATP-dependent Clp protease adaptor ClpS [Candidatus Sericytochromatia bacterium]|nr:ATP-dependent Clp protease adaptor ClpS [Candidatus Sericytochromatia bacterium]
MMWMPQAATAPLPTSAPQKTAEPRVTVRWLPPHKVIVHNNDHNTYEQVIGILMRAVPGMTIAEAIEHAHTIDESGSTVAYRGMVDEAETIAAKIRTIGITVTVEPDA